MTSHDPSGSIMSRLEKATFWHICIYLVGASWMFGGNIHWAKIPLGIWGTLGASITIAAWVQSPRRRKRYLLALTPFLILNGLVLLSTFNPSFQEFSFYETTSLRPTDHNPNLPSTARPGFTLRELWIYDGFYLAAFNLFLAVRHRPVLRRIATVAAINAAVLAVFGTIQKFAATDIFFGLEKAPNHTFFASFLYHNHWGAFGVLTAALGVGLAARSLSADHHRDIWHSPVFAALLPILLITVSVPLSSSRSSTLLVLALGMATGAYLIRFLLQRTRHRPMARWGGITAVVLVGLVILGGAYGLARPVIETRVKQTIDQLKRQNHYAFRESDQVYYGDSRMKLYEDTIRMARDKPWFGWGFGSYGAVFMRYNSQSTSMEGRSFFFNDAHSDWLEAWAELGIAGGACLLGMFIFPLREAGSRLFRESISGFWILGAGMIAVYALIEFPFANPAVALTFWCTLFLACRHASLVAESSTRHRKTQHSNV